MADPKKRPGPTTDQKPRNQTDEKHGSVKGEQRTGHDPGGPDTARGSEVDTRGSARTR